MQNLTALPIASWPKSGAALEALEAIEAMLPKGPDLRTATFRLSITGQVVTWGGDILMLTGNEPVSAPEIGSKADDWWIDIVDEDGVKKTVLPGIGVHVVLVAEQRQG